MQATMKNKTYTLPPMSLLASAPAQSQDTTLETEKTAQAIEQALASLKIGVTVVATHRGPTVTQYEVELDDKRLRVGKLPSYAGDLSLRLGVAGVRIIAPLPDRMTVGIEVPNKTKDLVNMRSVLEGSNAPDMELPLCLGTDVIGSPILLDLALAPHLILAGATGTGKSVGVNAIINSLLLFKTPEELNLILIDPKMVELSGYAGLPHLLAEPIVDMAKAGHALKWLCKEMDDRYSILRKAGARDIRSYNAKASKTMPRVVLVIDEVAELMLSCPEAETHLARLCAKGRAAGLHVICCTQRISVDVITGLIKANIPARVCFRVADKVNSRVVLDHVGAESLLGKGDMLYLAPGASSAIRAQGAYVSDAEIEGIVRSWTTQGKPQYNEDLFASDDEQAIADEDTIEGMKEIDGLHNFHFHLCMHTLYSFDCPSNSVLIRHEKLNKIRAKRYMTEAERLGLVTFERFDGSRSFKKTFKEWLTMLVRAGVELRDTSRAYKL